jgi:hypothetical protein
MRRSVQFQIFTVAGEPHTFQSSGQTYASPQEAEQAGLNAVATLNAKEEKKSTGGPASDEVCLTPAGHTHKKYFMSRERTPSLPRMRVEAAHS